MLTATTIPRHRPQYPGEIFLYLGCGSSDNFRTSKPDSLGVQVQHYTGKLDSEKIERDGWVLFTRAGTPVLLHLAVPRDRVMMTTEYLETQFAKLAQITGAALAVELQQHLGTLLSRFRSGTGFLEQGLRFDDQSVYGDLIVSLTAQARDPAAVDEQEILTRLLKAWDGDYRKQLAWYRDHGPSGKGETAADYRAEVEAFATLMAASSTALTRQLAALR
jgi:hypothetical protein